MKLAVMQPYFLPYLGYFDLLNMVDRWIVFDTPQYMKYGWVNRNRVLRMHSGWQYIMAPVKKHHHKISINQVEIASSEWTELILRQLEHYKKDAPFYAEVIAFLNECFSELSNNLAEVNTFLFRKVAARLGIERRIEVLSEMNLNLQGPISSPGDWGGAVAQAVGANEYINRPGGESFLIESEYRARGVKLFFQSYVPMTYTCGRFHSFEPDMSIVDVMMWNSRESIKQYLDTFRQAALPGRETPCAS